MIAVVAEMRRADARPRVPRQGRVAGGRIEGIAASTVLRRATGSGGLAPEARAAAE
ncbi:MAG: hypothetical protein R6V44_14155 [Paracoccaceae bacterium]